MTTTAPATRTDRAAAARQLADDGLSHRAIARELGVSKDTVRRDLTARGSLADAPDAPQLEAVLPGAHPKAVEAIRSLRNIDGEALAVDVRQACATRPYLLGVVRRAVELLAETGPLEVLDQLEARGLAEQLNALIAEGGERDDDA
ncbi:helix-turn-helix domain-containing protein [Streptomyces sp. NPDC059373]